MIPDELKKLHKMQGEESISQHRDSEYLGVEDFDPGAEPVLTIKALYYGSVTLREGKQNKVVIEFVEDSVQGIKNVRPMLVNATARATLRRLYKETSAKVLEGKQIKLHVIPEGARNPRTGEKVDCFRIKPEIPKALAKPSEQICSECGQVLKPFGQMSAEQLATYTKKKYGKCLCADCAKGAADKQTEQGATDKQTEQGTSEGAAPTQEA